jgi:hypothetical protein
MYASLVANRFAKACDKLALKNNVLIYKQIHWAGIMHMLILIMHVLILIMHVLILIMHVLILIMHVLILRR